MIGNIVEAVLVAGSDVWKEAANVLWRAHTAAATHLCDNMRATFGEKGCPAAAARRLRRPAVHGGWPGSPGAEAGLA